MAVLITWQLPAAQRRGETGKLSFKTRRTERAKLLMSSLKPWTVTRALRVIGDNAAGEQQVRKPMEGEAPTLLSDYQRITAALAPSPPRPGTPKKLFNRYEFQQRLLTLRAEVRAADDEYYGTTASERQLYSADEVRATPALRWLDMGARMKFLEGKCTEHQQVMAVQLPQLPQTSTPKRPMTQQRQVAEPPSPTLEPLVDEEGAAAQCPICLRELCGADQSRSLPTSSAAVCWTGCCGRAFHGHCFKKLSRCPMCRAWPLREASDSQAACTLLDTARAAASPGSSVTIREIVLPERVDGVRSGWSRPPWSGGYLGR